MKITVLGATGNAGSRLVAEALSRGHEVTAVVRNLNRANGLPAAARVRTADVGNVEEVSKISAGQDVVISAIRPASGHENDMIPTTRSLMDGLAQTGVRLLVVGGGVSNISMEDAAVVLLDEAERPRHHRTRFPAAY